jgi:hypothetical protein
MSHKLRKWFAIYSLNQLHEANFFLAVLTVARLIKKLLTFSDTPWLNYGAALNSEPLSLVDHTLTHSHIHNPSLTEQV